MKAQKIGNSILLIFEYELPDEIAEVYNVNEDDVADKIYILKDSECTEKDRISTYSPSSFETVRIVSDEDFEYLSVLVDDGSYAEIEDFYLKLFH